MRTFVVPDLHGRYKLARGLLEEAGIVDVRGQRRRNPEIRTVQLGDLGHYSAKTRDDDLRILRRGRSWFDVLLIGNHEYPYFVAPRGRSDVGFRGFRWFAEVEEAVRALFWRPAFAVGNTLVTHAGVAEMLALPADTAGHAEDLLTDTWQADLRHSYFATVGVARGGWAPVGGILWSDWAERRDHRFSQVHGHTPLERGPGIRDEDGVFVVNLDCGGHGDVRRIVGVWLDESGNLDGFVEYEL